MPTSILVKTGWKSYIPDTKKCIISITHAESKNTINQP